MAIMLSALIYSKQNELFIKLLILNWPLIKNRWQSDSFHWVKFAVKDFTYISDKSVFSNYIVFLYLNRTSFYWLIYFY